MTEPEQVFEKYVFFSSRKEREVFANVIQTILPMSLDAIDLAYSDNPNETFNHINERTQKILQGHPHPEEIQAMTGAFADGGEFELRGGALSIIISADRYNFELIDSMKHFLSPVFSTCIFRNQYIWGVDLYENYSRELLFETRIFASRSPLLEDPEIDIFRRDDGIIYKFRFNTRERFSTDDGIHFLAPVFMSLAESLRKKMYEGLEILHKYCTDKPQFRKLEPRTKIGREIKSLLSDRN